MEILCLRVQVWNRASEFDRRRVGHRQIGDFFARIARKTGSFGPVGVHRAGRVIGEGQTLRRHGIHHGTEGRLPCERLGKTPERLFLCEIVRLERWRGDLLQILLIVVRIIY